MIDEKIIENGFWISDENDKNNIGVKIVPVCGNGNKIESISILVMDRNHNDISDGEVEIYRSEFRKLIEFADLLREELVQ